MRGADSLQKRGFMIYSFESKVRFSECAQDMRLSYSGIVDYMQDASGAQSEELGIGMDELLKAGRGWFLIGWNIRVVERPKIGTELKISTWANDFKGIYGDRNMQIVDKNSGDVYAESDALYVFMDLKKMRPTRVAGVLGKGYEVSPRLESVGERERKLTVPEGGEEKEQRTVMKHDIDGYGHMNNARYVELAQDFIPKGFEVRRIRVEYKISAQLGEAITPVVVESQNEYGKCVIIDLRNKDGKTFACVEFDADDEVEK